MNPRGFGFVTSPDHDAFISPQLLRGYLTDDIVDADIVHNGDQIDVIGMRLIQRVRSTVVGTVETRTGTDRKAHTTLVIDPHVANIAVAFDRTDIPDGTVVTATLHETGSNITARLQTVHGPANTVDAIFARVMNRSNLTTDDRHEPTREPSVIAAAKKAPTHTGLTQRHDLRNLTTFTIDGPDTCDLDDALSIEPGPDGTLRLYVHIADVAETVKAGSDLDLAALAQTTSVYLPGWNRPMLPRELSEQNCSLLPGVERDTLTVDMCVDATGDITAADIYESVIVSDMRLTYQQAETYLTGADTYSVAPHIARQLQLLRTVTARLNVARTARGGIDMTHRNENGVDIVNTGGTATVETTAPAPNANLAVERAMVAANETVAAWLTARDLPGIYRTHRNPTGSKQQIDALCEHVGVDPHLPDQLDARTVAAIEHQFTMLDEQQARVATMLLGRCLERAAYSATRAPHFGLGSDNYLHFTSPIRRYADLAVHRIVKTHLRGQHIDRTDSWAETVAAICNRHAALANRAERETRTLMWMTTFEHGTRQHGTVIECGRHGVRVTLDTSGVTGTVPYTAWLPGVRDEHDLCLYAHNGQRLVAAGDTIEVVIDTCDLTVGTLTFTLPT